MLTEAWKPLKPWGWLMSRDLGTGEHVPCNPGELHGGGGEVWGFGGVAGHCALSGARTEWSIPGGLSTGWLQELVNLNPCLD